MGLCFFSWCIHRHFCIPVKKKKFYPSFLYSLIDWIVFVCTRTVGPTVGHGVYYRPAADQSATSRIAFEFSCFVPDLVFALKVTLLSLKSTCCSTLAHVLYIPGNIPVGSRMLLFVRGFLHYLSFPSRKFELVLWPRARLLRRFKMVTTNTSGSNVTHGTQDRSGST